MIAESIAAALQRGIVDIGDLVVLTAGVPAGISSRTNTIQVRVVEKTS
jgi:pyruvate kinase